MIMYILNTKHLKLDKDKQLYIYIYIWVYPGMYVCR